MTSDTQFRAARRTFRFSEVATVVSCCLLLHRALLSLPLRQPAGSAAVSQLLPGLFLGHAHTPSSPGADI